MNKILCHNDFPDIISQLRLEKHVNAPQPDGFLKWASIIDCFNKLWTEERPTVIDLGSNTSILPVVLQRQASVTAVDMEAIHPDMENKYIGDAFEYLRSIPDDSLDIAIDSCAIIHFRPTHNYAPNDGCYEIGKLLKKKLKPGGRLIIASDYGPNDTGEFITIDKIIESYTKAGLSHNPIWIQSDSDQYTFQYNNMTLGVVRLVFTK